MMDNTTENNQNLLTKKDFQDEKIKDLYTKVKFQKKLINELSIHYQKIISNYQILLQQAKDQLKSLDIKQDELNYSITKMYYLDIITRREYIARIKLESKKFNKNYKEKDGDNIEYQDCNLEKNILREFTLDNKDKV